MSFLRRVFGGHAAEPDASDDGDREADGAGAADDEADGPDQDAEERARELDLLRSDQARLDELRRRQLRYADRAWTPPAQGGERRADDAPEGDSGG